MTKNNRLVETNGGSFYPEINEDGSTVVFESDATNLTSSPTNSLRQIFAWHPSNSEFKQITLGNAKSYSASISNDGNRIVFVSEATNLVAGETDSNGVSDIFLYEANTSTITRINKNYLGIEATGGLSDQAKISGDGKTVVFVPWPKSCNQKNIQSFN